MLFEQKKTFKNYSLTQFPNQKDIFLEMMCKYRDFENLNTHGDINL